MKLITLSSAAFRSQYGTLDTSAAVHLFTNPVDTNIVLTLLAHLRPSRILEIGTAGGHMTANLTQWSLDDAQIYSIGTVRDLPIPISDPQQYENPGRHEFGVYANNFGKVGKVFFVTADSCGYDFGRIAPIEFTFIDGAHDFAHVLSDTLKVYHATKPGGLIAWHDFDSPQPWVEVSRALAQTTFPEPIYHVAGTEVAYLRKDSAFGRSAPSNKPTSTQQAAAEESISPGRSGPTPDGVPAKFVKRLLPEAVNSTAAEPSNRPELEGPSVRAEKAPPGAPPGLVE